MMAKKDINNRTRWRVTLSNVKEFERHSSCSDHISGKYLSFTAKQADDKS